MTRSSTIVCTNVISIYSSQKELSIITNGTSQRPLLGEILSIVFLNVSDARALDRYAPLLLPYRIDQGRPHLRPLRGYRRRRTNNNSNNNHRVLNVATNIIRQIQEELQDLTVPISPENMAHFYHTEHDRYLSLVQRKNSTMKQILIRMNTRRPLESNIHCGNRSSSSSSSNSNSSNSTTILCGGGGTTGDPNQNLVTTTTSSSSSSHSSIPQTKQDESHKKSSGKNGMETCSSSSSSSSSVLGELTEITSLCPGGKMMLRSFLFGIVEKLSYHAT